MSLALKVPVAVGPVIALPTSPFDPYDAPFANPAVLARAGVPFAILSEEGENERNLPFHAAMAAAFGWLLVGFVDDAEKMVA